MNLKYNISVLFFLLGISILFSQKDQNTKIDFFSKSKFEWEKWEVNYTANEKTNIINMLKADLKKNSLEYVNYLTDNLDDYHIMDVNSDGKWDIIYSGFAGSEKNSLLMFVKEDNEFVEKINTYGEIIEISRESSFSPITLKVMDNPCCEDTIYSFKQFNFHIENTKIFYRMSLKINFLESTIFPDTCNNNIAFETINEEYKLRNTPEIIDDINSNVIAVYPEGSIGTAIFSKEDQESNRVWWFVIMKNNKSALMDSLDDDSDLDYYSMGWMSSRFLKKISSDN